MGISVFVAFPASVLGDLYRERAFAYARKNRRCEESKVKPEVQSGAPECNFFARVASRQIAGQPAVETVFGCTLYRVWYRVGGGIERRYLLVSAVDAAIEGRKCRVREREKKRVRAREKVYGIEEYMTKGRRERERERGRARRFLLIELRASCVY
ncbi:hypothetical protein ALC60_04567 [Trachymyrmex zeteki]|uniref:Uncharacterized protein n=1 Tax=Mycetomoellerius zeteki TaxID=64791 RepID=A0A151X849_9HYME|nr:hypothetical protein ALC60_04567 [Trachymyrmex zeteki]